MSIASDPALAPGNSSAEDRDKSHSPDVRAATGVIDAGGGDNSPGSVLWISAGTVLATALAAVSPLPTSFAASAEPALVRPTPGLLGWLWDALALALPVGERGVRGDFATLLLILAVAAAAGLLASRMYRGPGRGAAALAAPPVCAALLLAWTREPEALASAPATLGFTLLAIVGLAALVGARVRGRGMSLAVWVHGGAPTLAAALLWPRVGPVWAALWLVCAGWTTGENTPIWRRVLVAVGLGLTAIVVAWALSPGLSDSLWTWPWGQELRLRLDLGGPTRWAGRALLALALALALLLVPLRWRGGGLVLALVTLGLVLEDLRGSLLPAPALLVLLTTAACGWIWLAGSVSGPRWLARGSAGAATLVVLGLAATTVVPVSAPLATSRSEASLLALQQRGLIAPGDVLLAHDPWLAAAFAAAQRDEGLRPDVTVYAVAEVDPSSLSQRLAAWSRARRRVLSDSFSYAGRWQPAWALDSGPLFWFVGTAGAGEREFTDLREHSPDLTAASLAPAERARWERLHIERARHRRALGFPDEALLALPLADETLATLAQRVQMAKLSRLPATSGSELGPGAWPSAPPPASSVAEAGDLLRALGDGSAGSEQLAEAAELGLAEAFGALARWQLRAGEEEDARATLETLAAAPVLRPQLLAVCRWLRARARAEQAGALLTGATPAAGHAPEELGVRLAVLRGLASP